ncbi:MAG: DNA adenine methylase [Cyanosarcina radialis HA8281-LM2]|jgi:DNA adenine methylase|nr:DNA adenine methylase [Cyanosarcina radialis HA8281-LM2]
MKAEDFLVIECMTHLPQTTLPKSSTTKARAILKWAGGKSQLIEQISKLLPQDLKAGKICRYAEPFIGGGAVFFYIAQTYNIGELYISDRNPELILLYQTIQHDVESLIEILAEIETKYFDLSKTQQRQYFYAIAFSIQSRTRSHRFFKFFISLAGMCGSDDFLNRTCFNGLFRYNNNKFVFNN